MVDRLDEATLNALFELPQPPTQHNRLIREAALARDAAVHIPAQIRVQAPARLAGYVPQPSRHQIAQLAVGEDQQAWPTDLPNLRRLLNDDSLARRLEQPLSTDVECVVPCAIWHLIAILEWRRRGGKAHPLAIRAVVVDTCRAGYQLTGEAIAGVLAAAGAM